MEPVGSFAKSNRDLESTYTGSIASKKRDDLNEAAKKFREDLNATLIDDWSANDESMEKLAKKNSLLADS